MSALAPPRKRADASNEKSRGRRPGKPVVQAKMTVGPARDRYEAEADRAAAHVIGGAPGAPRLTPLGAGGAQRAPEPGQAPEPEEERLQRTALRDGPIAAPASVETGVAAARGGGAPLPPATKTKMEAGFGRDFGAVRLHADRRAATMNDALAARAFTSGADIFFARDALRPGTKSGETLLAHELAHVAQQTEPGSVRRDIAQRLKDGEPREEGREDAPRTWEDKSNNARGIELDDAKRVSLFKLEHLKLPRIGKLTKGVSEKDGVTGALIDAKNFRWTGKGDRTVSDEGQKIAQAELWDQKIKEKSAHLAKIIETKFSDSGPNFVDDNTGDNVFFLRHKAGNANKFTLFGSSEQIAANKAVTRPPFAKTGKKQLFMDVDHYVEIQLGGKHSIHNLWLLDAKINRSSGGTIKSTIARELNKLVADADRAGFWDAAGVKKPRKFDNWPERGEILFASVKGGKPFGDAAFWTRPEIERGEHIDRLRELRVKEMQDMGLTLERGKAPSALTLFLDKNSAYRRVMKIDGDELLYRGKRWRRTFIRGFDMTAARFHREEAEKLKEGARIATLEGRAFRGRKGVVDPKDGREKDGVLEAKNLSVPVYLHIGGYYAAYIDRSAVNAALRSGVLTFASPVAFSEAGLTDDWELLARGTVTADNPLFAGFTFGITLVGDDVIFDAAIPTERLNFGPFQVTDANLSIGYGDSGLLYAGSAAFELAGVGAGSLEADRGGLAGRFAFEIDAFDPAEIAVAYQDRRWSGEGKLGLKPGAIPFVESANVEVAIDDTGFSMKGTAALKGPGVPEGTTLTIAYDQATGKLAFGAAMRFDGSAIPGLRSAKGALNLERDAEGAWKVAGWGLANVALPYVAGSGKVVYDNGFIDIDAFAKISRPPLSGATTLHVSNRPVDDAGQAIAGEPLETFRVWGGGEIAIAFGKHITGTAGVAFLENGEIEITGAIALPPRIELIKAKSWDKDLVDFPRIEAPIFGVRIPVVGSIGVFAFIGGDIGAKIAVGPGALVNSRVTVAYNPDHPEEASIRGGSTFEMRAGAEVALTVKGGVGFGIGVADITGHVGLEGALGIDLAGGGSVQVDWTPAKGLEVDASVFGEASPKFRVDAIAGIDADIAIYGDYEIASWRKTLAEIGPDMTWKASLPAGWSEADGLDLDIANLEITKPDIDLARFAKDVFERVT